jgi:hypothetical protein
MTLPVNHRRSPSPMRPGGLCRIRVCVHNSVGTGVCRSMARRLRHTHRPIPRLHDVHTGINCRECWRLSRSCARCTGATATSARRQSGYTDRGCRLLYRCVIGRRHVVDNVLGEYRCNGFDQSRVQDPLLHAIRVSIGMQSTHATSVRCAADVDGGVHKVCRCARHRARGVDWCAVGRQCSYCGRGACGAPAFLRHTPKCAYRLDWPRYNRPTCDYHVIWPYWDLHALLASLCPNALRRIR